MTEATSSAEPEKLFHYANASHQIDRDLSAEAERLAGRLQHFEATCSEQRVPVAYLADALRGYAGRAEIADAWVRRIGVGFQAADALGWLGAIIGPGNLQRFLRSGAGGRAVALPVVIAPILRRRFNIPWPPRIIIRPPRFSIPSWFRLPRPSQAPQSPQRPEPEKLRQPAVVLPTELLQPSSSPRRMVFKESPVPWDRVGSINWYGNTQYAYDNRDKLYSALQGLHSGIDFGVPKGTPIKNTFDCPGKVIAVDGKPYNYGANQPGSIVVDYGDYLVLYGHTSRSDVKIGDIVKPGDPIGTTGVSNGYAHLHLEVIKKHPDWDSLPPEKQTGRRPGDDRTNPIPFLDPELRKQLEKKQWDTFHPNPGAKWMSPDDQPDIHPGDRYLL